MQPHGPQKPENSWVGLMCKKRRIERAVEKQRAFNLSLLFQLEMEVEQMLISF